MSTDTFLNLSAVIAVLFFLLATGYICRVRGIIDNVASKRLSALILRVGQPMMIIGAFLVRPFDVGRLKEGLLYLLLGFLLHPLMYFLGLLFSPLFHDLNEKKINLFAITFTNAGFIGFPILEAVFPGKGAFNGAFFIVGFQVYLWTLGIIILARGRSDIRLTPKKAIFNHGTIPSVIGLALYLLKAVIPIPHLFHDYVQYLGNLCTPISLLIIGALLATIPMKAMLSNARLYLFNVIKLLLIPAAVCLILKLVTLPFSGAYEIILFGTLVAAMPSATGVTMLCETYDIEPAYSAQTVGTTSLFSLATLPLLFFFGHWIASL